MDLSGVNPLDFGLVGIVLVVVWKLLDVAKTLFLSKRVDPAFTMACQQDPVHFLRIKEIHEMTKRTEEEKAHGNFNCQWKDRDEVRDFMAAMAKMTVAADTQTMALTALTAELRLTRNGKK